MLTIIICDELINSKHRRDLKPEDAQETRCSLFSNASSVADVDIDIDIDIDIDRYPGSQRHNSHVSTESFEIEEFD